MSNDPDYVRDEQNHVYVGTSDGIGWRFVMKLVVGISIPLFVTAVINLFFIGQWVGSVNEKLSNITYDLSEFVKIQTSIAERVRILELDNAAQRGYRRGEE